MKLPKWLKELRPHLTWYLIAILLSALGVDAALSGGLSWTYKIILGSMGLPAAPPHFYFVLGCLIFCGILLSAILAFVLAAFMAKRSAPAAPAANPMPNLEELKRQLFPPKPPDPPKLPEPPKPVDLQGQILELYFYSPADIFGMGHTHVLIKAMIVNRGPDEATITHCGLQIRLGNFQPTGTVTEIPETWRIKKKREGVFLGTVFDYFPIGPRLGAQPHLEIYKKGHPHEGWLNFEFYSYGEVEFPNAEFELRLTDSLGGEHCIRKSPELYRRMGEIVVAEPNSVPSAI